MTAHLPHCSRPFLTTIFAWICLVACGSANTLQAQTPKPTSSSDPATHAAHVAAGTTPATAAPKVATGDPALAQQLAELRAKIAQLETTLAKTMPLMAAAPAGTAMPGMPGATPAASPAMSMGMGNMKPGGATQGMSASAAPAAPMAGMSGAAAPAGGATGMMGMMDKMMGMMDKMMSMDDAEMGMAGMGGGGAMPPAPAGAMSGSGGMAMDQMEMAGMMGMGAMGSGAAGAMPQSALPGFPGASHLYHIGATGFFLDHPQHITLTIEQQAGLNRAKEQALLAKSTADRAVEQAEQVLWTLTAADQPDATQIETKIREIEKLRGDERLSFIRAVGDASKLLTDEQRISLTGFAQPAPAKSMAAPAAAMPAGAMKDM